jgi:hypothetical protein
VRNFDAAKNEFAACNQRMYVVSNANVNHARQYRDALPADKVISVVTGQVGCISKRCSGLISNERFSLTLSLSRGERELPLDASGITNSLQIQEKRSGLRSTFRDVVPAKV